MVAYEQKFIRMLMKDIVELKWKNLPKEERKWAIRAYRMSWGEDEEQFKADYIDFIESKETKWMDENMPFSDY